MDDADSTTNNQQDIPSVGPSGAQGSNDREVEVLEGEVFRSQERRDEAGVSAGASASEGQEQVGDGDAGTGQGESVERGLAQYVFVREEREREVRLFLRDASPADVALTFRTAGARLITLSAERASAPGGPVATPPAVEDADEVADREEDAGERLPRRKVRRSRAEKTGPPAGEALLRYFYALGEIVYTVSIVSPAGVVASVAGTYPLAARSERELAERLAIVFV